MNSEKLNLSYISPVCIFRMLARNFWMVIAAALIFSMATAVYIENFRTPVYRASMTYAVTAKKETYSNANITSAKEVAAVVAELIETDVITDNLRKSSPDLADFSGKISASLVPESNFISVSAEDVSPEKAYVAPHLSCGDFSFAVRLYIRQLRRADNKKSADILISRKHS